MILYVARHGQTTGDIENRYGGDYDDHLTEEGNLQSAELAEQLAGKGIQKLFASPLIRAQETASIIADKLGLSAEVFPALKERNSYGVLTGLNKEDALQQYPELVAQLKSYKNTITGAEPYDVFGQRIAEALEILSQAPFDAAAAITHGGPLHYIFREILQLGEIKVSDCSYVQLEVINGQYKVLGMQGIVVSDPAA